MAIDPSPIIRRPEARLFACLHIVVSVSWLAALVSDVDSLRGIRKSQLQRAKLILSPPNREQIMGLDKDGKGVERVEFVVGMMMSEPEPCTHSPARPGLSPAPLWSHCD